MAFEADEGGAERVERGVARVGRILLGRLRVRPVARRESERQGFRLLAEGRHAVGVGGAANVARPVGKGRPGRVT